MVATHRPNSDGEHSPPWAGSVSARTPTSSHQARQCITRRGGSCGATLRPGHDHGLAQAVPRISLALADALDALQDRLDLTARMAAALLLATVASTTMLVRHG